MPMKMEDRMIFFAVGVFPSERNPRFIQFLSARCPRKLRFDVRLSTKNHVYVERPENMGRKQRKEKKYTQNINLKSLASFLFDRIKV